MVLIRIKLSISSAINLFRVNDLWSYGQIYLFTTNGPIKKQKYVTRFPGNISRSNPLKKFLLPTPYRQNFRTKFTYNKPQREDDLYGKINWQYVESSAARRKSKV